ncbi:MAG TPA: DUF2279 domain-containing protein [Kofleriaceae bacterium]|nr:DUF2279 domain-containing protein [Kofleriaceae bacterium]
MCRCVATALLFATLQSSAAAQTPSNDSSDHDPDGATSPWVDLSQQPLLAVRQKPARDHKLAASLTLGGLYAGFIGWTYLAWYRRPSHEFRWADPDADGSWKIWTEEGWFGKNGYAGGADKMGHAWATLALARLGTEMLNQWGGYDRLTSAIVGTALSETLFLGVELRDGTSYAFSKGDFVFNTLGAGLAFAQSVWPSVDDAVDLRVEYFPSKAYRDRFSDKTDFDIAEDYSGQTYHLAFHLGAVGPLRRWRYGSWSRFVDLTFGFESRGYKPDPLLKPDPVMCMETGMRCDFDKERNLFVGLSLNAQGLFDWVLRGRSEGWRKVTHGTFEVFSIPYTTLRVGERTAVPDAMVPDEQ